ncbi:hypothetical protein E4U21_006083 [Claviceps maximensis]|nr:hypothetical protein E4U21_006083 [Claviceps maximensis]
MEPYLVNWFSLHIPSGKSNLEQELMPKASLMNQSTPSSSATSPENSHQRANASKQALDPPRYRSHRSNRYYDP